MDRWERGRGTTTHKQHDGRRVFSEEEKPSGIRNQKMREEKEKSIKFQFPISAIQLQLIFYIISDKTLLLTYKLLCSVKKYRSSFRAFI